MQYYVIGPDGSKYGPADVPTLKGWVAENRLSPDSMLEDFNTGQRLQAQAVQGLFEGAPTATAAAGPTMGPAASQYAHVPTPGGPGYYNAQGSLDNGQSEVTLAWVFGAVGLFCCGIVFCPLGIWKANEAMKKGNPSANAAKIFCIVTLCINLAFVVFRVLMVTTAMRNGTFPPQP